VAPLDLTQQPVTYTQASIANLFYWSNVLHDVHYLYGFTESARNFQVNNYGRGGLGNDAVLAETQDGSGTNNANFFTPPDGAAPRMQMFEFTSTSPRRDSSFDSQIVVHEYGHGVSNRLTGNGSGLGALQSGGMGEGWSDWWALMFTQKTAADTTTPQGAATYSLGQPDNGPGFREFRYQFAITNTTLETFNDFNQPGGTQVHQAGTRWAAALWDLNHLLIQKYGYEPNIYNSTSTAGNIRALHLVMNGLKLQPLNPSFIQARDAILLADTTLNGGANHLEIWTAFARRGLGQFASTSSSNSSIVTTSFVVPPGVGGLAVTASVPANGSTITVAPTTFTLTVSAPVNPATLQGADLVVNGVPANSVSYVPGSTTITFNYASPPVVQGLQNMQVAAGAFNRASDNSPVSAFTASFRFDATPLQVVATSPPINGTFTLPTPFTYDVQFNEAVTPSSVQTTDLMLSGLTGATVTAVTVLPGNTVARFTLGGIITEGTLTASIAAGAIADAFGNGGNAFTANYQVDFGIVAYPTPLEPKNPLGSMIYDPTVPGVINFPGDTDTFTLNIDAGQTITVLVDPTGSTTQELFGGVGNGSGAAAGRLLRVNQTNAAGTVVSDPVNPGGITGLVYDPSSGFLLGSTIQTAGDFSTLVRIDPVTGANLGAIGAITVAGIPIGIGDLAIQPGTNNLYGIRSNTDGAGLGGRLYLINKSTGAATLVGNTGAGSSGGIAFAPDGSLYQTAHNNNFDFTSLNRINPANAARISTVPLPNFFDGLAIRSDGVFFAATGGSNDQIFTINPVTGAVTLVGGTLQGSTSDLAFGPGAGIAPNIQLRDPANVIIGGASAGPGQNALVQSLNTTTVGTYRIAVSGASGSTGGYTVQVILNAALEAEGVVTGASNGTQATAQDINGSLINPRPGPVSAQRGAVLGQIAGTSGPGVNVIQNGTFDSGSFAPWTVSAIGVNGWQLNNGALDPQGPAVPQPPIAGAFDIVTDQTGPGLRSISQSFVVPSVVNSATLTWSDRIQNFGNAFQDPNQEYRVQITDAGGTVLQTVFSTNPGDPLIQLGPNNRSANLTALLQSRVGQTLRLRFEEQDNLGFFNVTLDNINLSVESAPPSTDVDFYSFNLAAGNRITLALEALTGAGANVELRNSNGAVLATGLAGPTNFDRVINFQATSTGVYYARVSGPSAATYSLVLTKNAAFDTEPNDSFAGAQNISDAAGVLGHVSGGASGPAALYATGNNGASLIRINPATGVATTVGNFGHPDTFAGAFTPDGAFWTIVNGFNGGAARLATVNLNTGAATPIGNVNWTGAPAIALEADNAGNLYAGNWNGAFFSVNKTTGQMTPIGQMNLGGLMDFTFDNAGVLWAVDGNNGLFRINTATGQGTFQTFISGVPGGSVMGMMVDPGDSSFYITTYTNPGSLYRLNTATGVTTLVPPGGGLGVFPHGGDFSHGAVAVGSAAVVPGALANVEGNVGNAFPFHIAAFGVPSMRYQQIYTASQFSSAGIIDALRFRRDAGQSPFTVGGIDVKINLSYAATSVATASPVFANNVGAGVVTVFDGLLTLSSTGAGSPNPLDIVIDVANTFNYDPAQGNLLVDIFVRNSPNTRFFDATDIGQQGLTGNVTQRIFATNVNATSGLVGRQAGPETSPYGLVTRFDFLPSALANDDWYSINVTNTASTLRLQTNTPADGPGQFVNTLNPRIELYSPANLLIASGTVLPDGRNEFIQHQPTVTGLYRVRVLSEGATKGEYFLSKNFSPTVTAAVTSPINEGQSAFLSGTITDDALDSHTVHVNWGPGETPTTFVLPAGVTTFSASHLYADDNPSVTSSDSYPVTVTVTDEHGAVGTSNAPPPAPTVPSDIFSTHDGGSRLGAINPITGVGTDIGPFGTSDTWAAAFDTDGTLYTLINGLSPNAVLARVNKATGAVTPIGAGVGTSMITLEVAADGTMYGIGAGDRILYRIDKTLGAATPIGNTGINFTMDTAINSAGTLYATTDNMLWTVNLATGASTLVGTINGPQSHLMGLMFDGNDMLFATDFVSNSPLYRINLATMTATSVGLTGFNFPHGGDIFVSAPTGGGLEVIVNNVSPSVTSLNAPVISEGQTATVSGAFFDPGLLDTHTVVIAWGSGEGSTTLTTAGPNPPGSSLIHQGGGVWSFTATHLYQDDNPSGTSSDAYAVSVRVTDDDSGSDDASTTVTVNNVAPTVTSFSAPSAINEDDIATVSGIFFDPGLFDSHTVVITWGAGEGSTTLQASDLVNEGGGVWSFFASHQYEDDNPSGTASDVYTVGVLVTDDDTGSDDASTTVTINNVAPTIASLSSDTIDENGAATISGAFFDPGLLDTHTVVIAWGVGEGTTTIQTAGPHPAGSSLVYLGGGMWEFSASHQYLDDNPTGTAADVYTISVTVTDDDTGADTGSTSVTVNNVAPEVAPIVGPDPGPGVRGQTLAFSGTFTDVGTQDTHSAVWDWGDGSSSAGIVTEANGSGGVTGSHVYVAAGPYTVTLTVTDDDTGATAVTKIITIVSVALQTDACDPTKTQLAVGGTTGNDVIAISSVDSAGNIEVIINAVSQGVFAPSGRILAFGQAGDDDIEVSGGVANAAWLYGDDGNDRLKGGNGPSVLLGGLGEDWLIGGGGRDLLIGGLGADRVVGNSDQDILIGGTTAFDANDHALCAILDEWNSERDYATRIANIQGTGAGPRLNENFFLKTTGVDATVFDDGAADRLTGSAGIDWFFAGLGDIITSQSEDEELG